MLLNPFERREGGAERWGFVEADGTSQNAGAERKLVRRAVLVSSARRTYKTCCKNFISPFDPVDPFSASSGLGGGCAAPSALTWDVVSALLTLLKAG
jgi:hypothetical protein